ncbi:endonuclease/exonuclease/phosphatase family protein [Pedobacter sp. JY14-1]|uniref:endonuclease/exonuclease/phosphatase family protein n=1 Tax=Pedobacter sp. JY14-1 TaxID=3034151 RepID=UPI0023E1D55F|nr:endonuclease/exonuclease/phosphatase family protein [Pedobacter sp. JY14-1]
MFKRLFSIFLFSLFVLSGHAQQLNIATFNLRYKNNGDERKGNGWEQRMPVIADLIRFHDFDIFGTQEGLHEQLLDLTGKLTEYSYVGVGRNNGKEAGEHAAIFYKKNMFKLISSGNFWLSEKPEKPNRGWDAALPRICSWGQFEHIASGKKFFFFNTHFDHVGLVARRESAKLILSKIGELAGDHSAILTGDFNVDQTNEIYDILTGSVLQDTYETAHFKYALNGTFNHFDINTKTNSRIDHILHTPCIVVKRYGVLTDSYRTMKNGGRNISTSGNFPKEVSLQEYEARLPSDHFPVMVVVELKDCK